MNMNEKLNKILDLFISGIEKGFDSVYYSENSLCEECKRKIFVLGYFSYHDKSCSKYDAKFKNPFLAMMEKK